MVRPGPAGRWPGAPPINLGCGRKYVAWLNNGGRGEPIVSLHYFRNILDELRIIDLHSPYHEFCRRQAGKFERRWLESRSP
ncbi:MAG: hypothetical protein V3S71_01280 [Acidobacteriota bacterium]